jgi:heme-degrading monooxygenase HmoA
MNARVTTAQGTPENLDESIRKYREEVLPSIEAMEGFKGTYLLVNRVTGKVINVSLWDSDASERASAAPADSLRAQTLAPGSGEAAVETYEVVIQPGEEEGQRLASAVAQAARELEGQVRRFAASDEVAKVRRQVETSFRSFEEWARHRGGPPPQE